MDAYFVDAGAPGLAAPERFQDKDVLVMAPVGGSVAQALARAENEKAPDGANVEGQVKQKTKSVSFEQIADDRKAFATLRAHLALKGYELYRQRDGAMLITKWGLLKTLADVDEASKFLQQIGGAR